MPRLGLAEHFRRARGTGAPHLVLQGDERATLVSEGLNFAPQLLSRLAELGVAGHLNTSVPLTANLAAVGVVIGDQLLLLSDLRRERGDQAFLLEFSRDALGDVGDCVGFTLTRLLEGRRPLARYPTWEARLTSGMLRLKASTTSRPGTGPIGAAQTSARVGQNFPTRVKFRKYFQALKVGPSLSSPPCLGKPRASVRRIGREEMPLKKNDRQRPIDPLRSTKTSRTEKGASAITGSDAERPAIEQILLCSERWFRDGEPRWTEGRLNRPAMTAKEAEVRRRQTVKLLRRHGKSDPAAMKLAARLESCRPRQRCLSLACHECCRAEQRNVFVAAGEQLMQRSKRTGVTAISVVYVDARIPDRGLAKVPSLFGRVAHYLRGALIQAGVRQAIGGFDVSANEDATVGFAPHYRPHAWLLIPTSQIARCDSVFRQHFPPSTTVRRPVVMQTFDGDRRGLAYALKGDFERRISLPREVQSDETVKRRNTRHRSLLARQKLELALALDRLGLDARMFFLGLRLVNVNGEPIIRDIDPSATDSAPPTPLTTKVVAEPDQQSVEPSPSSRPSKELSDKWDKILRRDSRRPRRR